MTLSLDQFRSIVCQCGLLTSSKLAEVESGLPPNRRPQEASDLAKELVRQGLLTRYQTANVLAGKGRNLVYGEYTVLDKIGAGGMGQVFKAEHRRMKRIVALKLLPPAAMRSPDAVTRFQREVQAAARLIHPNIVTAFDAGESAGVHFLVMQYVEGDDLQVVSRERSPLPVAEALDYILQAARGLAYAHEQGVVHRDIKPANLLLDPQGVVRILDMGLARFDDQQPPAVATAQPELTQAGQVMGTLDYMAPEQAFDTHHADARSDIYSLGCTLYRLLTGVNMYQSSTHVQSIVAHREQPIPPLSVKRPDIPTALERVYFKMVAKRPEDRYQTMKEVIAALEQLKTPTAMPVATLVRAQPLGETALWPAVPAAEVNTLANAAVPVTATQYGDTATSAAPLARITQVVASEKSKHLVAKLVGGAFATIIAPLFVVLLQNYLFSNNSPAPPAATAPPATAANVATGPAATTTTTTVATAPGASSPITSASSAAKPAASPQAPPSDWFDPLPLLYAPLDADAGPRTGKNEWEKQADGWHYLPDGKAGRLKMPVLIDGPHYQIECEFTLPADDSDLHLALPLGNGELSMAFNLTEGINAGRVFHPAFRPTKGTRNKAVLRLEKAENLASGDQLDLKFNGSSFRLFGQREKWAMPRPLFDGQSFYVLALQGPVIVHSYRIRALEGGKTKPLRREPAPPLAKNPFDVTMAHQQRESWAKFLKVPTDVTNPVGMRLVLIPPGEFQMGATARDREVLSANISAAKVADEMKVEQPQHRVVISRPFYMATTEVMISQFRRFAASNPKRAAAKAGKGGVTLKWDAPGYEVTDVSPVTLVTWDDAIAYCNWLGDQEKLPHAYDDAGQSVPHTDVRYRLPTEAEWEFACRAGTNTTWFFGDDAETATQYAVIGPGRQHSPTGSKKPNAFGLFDMSGGVWEFCQDWFEPDYYAHSPVRDPLGPETGVSRAARGGSWNRPIVAARSAHRHGDSPSLQNNSTGFRVVKDVPLVP